MAQPNNTTASALLEHLRSGVIAMSPEDLARDGGQLELAIEAIAQAGGGLRVELADTQAYADALRQVGRAACRASV